MSQYAFFFDGTRCTACKTCVYACKDNKDLGLGMAYRRVIEYVGGSTNMDNAGIINTNCFAYSISVACCHCDNAICSTVCPTGAMQRDKETGLIIVDNTVCIGCGYCVLSCPYRAPKVDRTKGYSVKCDGCNYLVKKGEAPICVLACPTRALGFGTIDKMKAKGERASIAPLPDKKHTEPNMFIKPSKDSKAAGTNVGHISNPLEVL